MSFHFFIYKKKSRPVSRILSSLIIYLDAKLLLHSSRLPFYIERAALNCRFTWRCTAQSLPDFTTAELYFLSVALVRFNEGRVLPAMLPYGVRTFLSCQKARAIRWPAIQS